MNLDTMNTLDLAAYLRNAHLEMEDGATAEIKARGAANYRAAKAYIASQPKPTWRK